MFKILRLILIDSYKPGTLQEVRLDGPTNLNGVNGAGKTTLLRLIPLFFGESPSRLVPKSRVNESFVQHYLPNESSYIIFEYQRLRQTCQAVMYRSLNDGGLCYRFVAKAFALDDYLDTLADGSRMPVSCRDLYRRMSKLGIDCSTQISARNEYRTVIQNLPHAKGTDMRQLISRFSFCESSTGRRLQHIEKIVTGMFMRTTDFRDLREMLVSCIEEDRESIKLELKTETLHDWCQEYRAYRHMEAHREPMQALEQTDEALGLVRHELAELAVRVRKLANKTQQEHAETEQSLREAEQTLAQIKADWETRERSLKREQAETEASLTVQQQILKRLDAEKAEWDGLDMDNKIILYETRETTRVELDHARQSQRALLDKVSDIDAQFQRMKAEKEKDFQQRHHAFEGRLRDIELQATREESKFREDTAQLNEQIREQANHKQQAIHQRLQALKETRGQLSSQLADIQADPELLQQRELKRASMDDAQSALEQAKDKLTKLETTQREHRDNLRNLEQSRRQLGEQRQQIVDEETLLRRQLEADANTLLGFLRENHPTWTDHIAKLIKPDLLMSEALSPVIQETGANSFYGLGVALETLTADPAASETALREAIDRCRNALDKLKLEESKLDGQLAMHQKTSQSLEKERREIELGLGQARSRLKQVKEEAASLERQIQVSKQERGQSLKQKLEQLQAELQTVELSQVQHQAELNRLIKESQLALQDNVAALKRLCHERENALQQDIHALRHVEKNELAELDAQRLASLERGGVDPNTLFGLERLIDQLAEKLRLAELAADLVEKYQRWLAQDWARWAQIKQAIQQLDAQIKDETAVYHAELAEFELKLAAVKSKITQLDKHLHKLSAHCATLAQIVEELARYPVLAEGSVVLDASHSLSMLQQQKHESVARERELSHKMSELVTLLKRAMNQFPGTRPASHAETTIRDIGVDAPDHAWLSRLRAWFDSDGDELKRWLVMQAHTFGSAVRNYQQELARFDRGIDSLSRRLAASIDRNIGFDKIEAIQARLISKVDGLGYWQKIVVFTEHFDAWQRSQDSLVPDEEFADTVQQIAGQLQAEGRLESKLVNLLDLEIAVTEHGKVKRATHDEELRQISSHGLSYLILCVFFIALVNMIRRDQAVTIIWPMDELKDLHQMNIERLLTILEDNHISLLSAFPDPDPEILKSFVNRYEIYGYRELVEMVIDDGYVANEVIPFN